MVDTSEPGPSRKPLEAFVSFPSPYTQGLIVKALVALVPELKLSLLPPAEDDTPALQWADYDLLSFDAPHANPSKYLISSYIYRKALIRKHQLHKTLEEYIVKAKYRKQPTVLENAVPRGWVVELQFADELDELLLDELGELRQEMDREEGERGWWILKPGFADRAQGIRLFSTEEQLREIFESFEPESDDEDSYDDDAGERLGDDEDDEGTGVMTSQLRHFVIQEYVSRPLLFDISQHANKLLPPSPEGFKFHLRAYVLVSGGYTVHLARTMLALFSGSSYVHPATTTGEDLDLRPHLTNTCLQTDAFGAPAPPEELVKLFWELEGLDALSAAPGSSTYNSEGKITREWLDQTFGRAGEVIGESVKAGAECGSFGLQLLPNAFEIFGVDLLLSFPPDQTPDTEVIPIPRITLLEYNASPDFHQTGERLRPLLADMFKGVVRISIAPFFKLELNDEDEGRNKDWEIGAERYGWRLVGRGEVRGPGM